MMSNLNIHADKYRSLCDMLSISNCYKRTKEMGLVTEANENVQYSSELTGSHMKTCRT